MDLEDNNGGIMFKLIVGEIDAGGGWKGALYWDEEERLVKEVKAHDSEPGLHEFTIPIDDFDPEIYGEHGNKFLELIGETE